jgi:hypothetical protein
VAVWFDDEGSGFMYAAKLSSTDLGMLGASGWVLTDPIASSDVNMPTRAFAQTVGVDINGNAIAVWGFGPNAYTASLSFGSSTWSSPTNINAVTDSNTLENPSIAVAPTGAATVSWTKSASMGGIPSFPPYNLSFSTYYSRTNNLGVLEFLWSGETTGLFTIKTVKTNKVSPVAIDSLGAPVLAVTESGANCQGIFHRPQAGVYLLQNVTSVEIAYNSVATDENNNITFVWIDKNGLVQAATYPYAAGVMPAPYSPLVVTNLTTLSSTGDINSSPRVVTDAAGNAIAVWTDASGGLASARFSFSTQMWTALPLLSLGGEIASNISLAGDANGNAVASWTLSRSTKIIQAAVLLTTDSSWGSLEDLPGTFYDNDHSQITLTPTGDAILVWENVVDSNIRGQILSSVLLNAVPASKP